MIKVTKGWIGAVEKNSSLVLRTSKPQSVFTRGSLAFASFRGIATRIQLGKLLIRDLVFKQFRQDLRINGLLYTQQSGIIPDKLKPLDEVEFKTGAVHG